MGCAFCIPVSEGIDPTLYFPYGLPQDLVHVTPESPQELQDKFVEGLAASFCGTNEQAPEPVLSWGYMSPGMNDDDHTKPLSKEVTESKDFSERIEFFRYVIRWSFVHAGRHGGCFALKESDKLVAFTITLPPNNRGLYKLGFCEMMHVVGQLGGFQKMPKALTEGERAIRMDVMDKAMGLSHKTHCPNDVQHIYVWCFGVKPGCQGNGYGKKLITYLGECADRMKVPTYLEANGAKNERFYGNNGYKVEERYPLVYTDKTMRSTVHPEKKNHSFQPDGLPGMSACVRPSGPI
jgi:GNAT superfamily N-acetyltransferase